MKKLKSKYIKIDHDENLELYKRSYIYKEVCTNEGNVFINKKTKEKRKFLSLAIITFDEKGNDLKKEDWLYEKEEDWELVEEDG